MNDNKFWKYEVGDKLVFKNNNEIMVVNNTINGSSGNNYYGIIRERDGEFVRVRKSNLEEVTVFKEQHDELTNLIKYCINTDTNISNYTFVQLSDFIYKIHSLIKIRNVNPQSLDVFKSSIGKTVIIVFDIERKNDLPISLPSKKVGVIENIGSNKVWLNVNGCLEVYPFEVIKVMTQKGE